MSYSNQKIIEMEEENEKIREEQPDNDESSK